MGTRTVTRRRFMADALAAGALVGVVPAHVLGGPGRKAPSDVITRGVVGTGGRGQAFLHGRVIAVCDVDKARREAAAKKIGTGCTPYNDFRELLEVQEIDEVCIATPPHWHALVCIHAAQAGKDILCEKPMTKFIREGRVVSDTVRRYGRVFQIGTYGRFGMGKLRKLIESGRLGKPLVVRAGKGQGYPWNVKWFTGRHDLKPQPVPAQLDYNMWLGPAPYKPYHPHRVHFMFRCYWDYDGGGLADQGQHHLDPIQYMLAKDDAGPAEVEAVAPRPAHPDACGPWSKLTIRYDDDVTIVIESGEWGPQPEALPWIEGPNGKVWRSGATDPPGLLDGLDARPNTKPLINFETAMRTRRPSGGAAESSHRSSTLFHLGNIAIRLGRTIRWDPAKEQCIGDDEANRLADIPMRAPWHL